MQKRQLIDTRTPPTYPGARRKWVRRLFAVLTGLVAVWVVAALIRA